MHNIMIGQSLNNVVAVLNQHYPKLFKLKNNVITIKSINIEIVIEKDIVKSINKIN